MTNRDKARKYALERAEAERRAGSRGAGWIVLGVCAAILAALAWATFKLI